MAWLFYPSNRDEYLPDWTVLDTPADELGSTDSRIKAASRLIRDRQSKLHYLNPYYAFPSNTPGPIAGFRYPDLGGPIRLQVIRRNKIEIPDIALFDASMIVTTCVRDAIESIEPEVHNYLPVEVIMLDRSLAASRWLLNICTQLDTIAMDKSEDVREIFPPMLAQKFPGWSRYNSDLQPGRTKIAVYRDRIAGRAIRFEYKLGWAMCSDKLHDWIVEHNVRAINWYRRTNPVVEV
jgi:hypothetical protein